MAIVDVPPAPQPDRGPLKLAKQTEAQRRTARIAGWLFVVTFVTSIPEMFLYKPLLKHTNYILGSGAHTGDCLGRDVSRVLLAISGIGYRRRAVSDPQAPKPEHQPRLCRESHPRINHHHRRRHKCHVRRNPAARRWGSRCSKCRLTRPRRTGAGRHPRLDIPARPRFCAGFGNGLLLGYLMYKSGLVPRGMAMLGLIGGPLIFASGIAILFGAFKNGHPRHTSWRCRKSPGRRRLASISSSRGSGLLRSLLPSHLEARD